MTRFLHRFAFSRRRFDNGYRRTASVISFNHDGVEIARARNNRRWLPVWHIAVFLYMVMLVRLVTIADIGPASYANRMDQMSNGSFIERVTARAMYMDPVSRALATRLRKALDILS